MAGAAGTGLSLVNQYNKAFPTGKEGGVVKMASGGITSGVPAGKLPSMLEKLSDNQLTKKNTARDMDPLTKDMVDTEQARRSQLRGLASGGAVAFADGKMVEEDPQELANQGITAESAKQKRVIQAEPTEAAPVQDTKFDQMLASYNRERPTKPATNLMQAEVPATEGGINAEHPAVASALNALQKQGAGYKTTMDKSVAEIAKEQQDMYAQMGIVNPAIAEQAGLKARKATVETDAQELAKSRLIQFLVDWGKTPGSAVKGAINAGSNLIDSSIGDDKLRKKLLSDLDGVDRDINKAEYLRKTGDVDKATAIQRDAGAKYYAINEKILEYNAKIELQQMKNELAASKIANKNGVVQQAEVIATGMVAQGAPDNAVTQAAALKQALAMQPSVTSAGVSAASQQAIAGPKIEVARTQAEIDADRAATALAEERRKQKKDLDEAVDDKLRARRKDISAAAKADKAAGIEPTDPKSKALAIKKEIEASVRQSPGFEALAATPASAAAKPPAAPVTAKPAAPTLKWDPKTNQFIK